jgi:hypothetical protein
MKPRLIWLLFALVANASGTYLTYAAQQKHTLSVTGYQGELAVIDSNGRHYVEIEALANLSNSSLKIQGNRMTLTLPGSSNSRDEAVQPESDEATSVFSKEFIKAGMEEMAAIREWRRTLGNAVEKGFRVSPDWVDNYGNRAQQNLHLASLAVSTDADQDALPLLTNVFNNMKQLSDGFLKLSSSMTYIRTDSLNNNPLDQKILKCARSLASMASSGQFVDDGSCH